jgi:predicted ATPase
MKITRLTIKNYRGFSDQSPAVLELGNGLTALLGPNNAGKSSLKLFFYELRELFVQLARSLNVGPNLQTATSGQLIPVVNYLGTSDSEEIFNNTNGRDITISVEIIGLESEAGYDRTLYRVDAVCQRASPNSWRISALSMEDPSEQISFPNGASINTVRSVIDSRSGLVYDFSHVQEVFGIFANARYYGAFRNAINQGSGRHFDFQTGSAFIDLWNSWKTAGNKAQSRAIGKITEEIRRLFEFDQLEINASASLKTLLVTINSQPYRLAELGSGISQFVMALGNAATDQPSLILIDEPETNLHPSLQIDFLLTLVQYANVGCIFSTHSVGLARSVADKIYSIQKGPAGPIVRPFEATPSYSEFLGELSFSSFVEMGHDTILLVEGVNDVKVVQRLLRLFGKEHTTVILPLGGDQMVNGNREQELMELKRLSSRNICIGRQRETQRRKPCRRAKAAIR